MDRHFQITGNLRITNVAPSEIFENKDYGLKASINTASTGNRPYWRSGGEIFNTPFNPTIWRHQSLHGLSWLKGQRQQQLITSQLKERPTDTSHARGWASTPSRGHCSIAVRKASCSASSARSKSPSSRIRVAKMRRDSPRYMLSTLSRIRSAVSSSATGLPSRLRLFYLHKNIFFSFWVIWFHRGDSPFQRLQMGFSSQAFPGNFRPLGSPSFVPKTGRSGRHPGSLRARRWG